LKRVYNILILPALAIILSTNACTTSNKGTELGINDRIHHDDFDYVVTDYSVKKKITGDHDSISTRGNFFIVSFRVENHALGTSHRWDNSIAYVIDDEKNIFENRIEAQKLINSVTSFGWKEEYITRPQSTDTVILVFELPESAGHPCLMVRGETMMGDLLNGNKFRKAKIKLY
jgi:hypothetical protein